MTTHGERWRLLTATFVHGGALHQLMNMAVLWTAGTSTEQLFGHDSFIVLYIAFVIGPQHWPIPQFLAVGTVNYIYKMCAAVALIPLLYVARAGIKAYLGGAEAERLRAEAAAN